MSEEQSPLLLEERRKALRALLRKPLLCAGGAEAGALALVRRHFEWLRTWFERNAGWRLRLEGETARLYKRPSGPPDPTRAAPDFTRRHYVLLCLALAALERAERQITLGRLAQGVVELLSSDPELGATGFELDLERQAHRRELVRVVRLLIDFSVLTLVHGDEEQFVHQEGDALYNSHRTALALFPANLASSARDDSLEARLEAVSGEFYAPNDPRRVRHRLVRQLLDDPVLYLHELDAEELAYLQSQRPHLVAQIVEGTGLVPEIREEGIAMACPDVGLTDRKMPHEGTRGHHTLLLAGFLAERLRLQGGQEVSRATLEAETSRLIEQHRKRWSKAATAPGQEIALTAEALDCMEALRLIRVSPEGVTPLPPVARYAVARVHE